ncbi:hypothetical protein SPRG_09813 [Saprolegnia parasitica CBS 223.65]|uniref:Uncharacterized protein n=1 Tax=Saprolegnia parasitica (strain CBS 223.65) TaxID=695850 RepID=A0A067C1L3_SAPPC|nr:hypothetical protein SPRG_09813 [Saprolegnia parasitica CBS 223.65]KDO24423.1 hypothetical protein SPRG_09813 [Saprolegnia parasitica CBS 223.65]|eukprot:XP_012204853.1 hypothetical protein SPRG_09813 [Saprolegnia parasitica CBS 223.65]
MLNLVGPVLVPVAEDLSAAIVAAVLCASLLLTAGILQQGAQPSMFQDGLIFFRPVCHVAADNISLDAATDDAGVAEMPTASCTPPGSIGAQLVLTSHLPTLTLLLSIVVVAGAVVVASTTTT